MKKGEFEKLVSDLVGESVKILLLKDQQSKKWYDKEYTIGFEELKKETRYGVVLSNSGFVEFDFDTGKNEDNFLKSFISQYTSKSKKSEIIDGKLVELSKHQKLDRIVKRNSDRVNFGLFYTTLYGIGLWDFFNSEKTHKALHESMDKFLRSNGIEYKNEYSDARWVWRYKFNSSIEKSNDLLNEFSNYRERIIQVK